jgi:predicted ATPase
VGVEWKSRDAVIEEPGRRIVQEQTRTGGQALPWLDMTAFLRGAMSSSSALVRMHSPVATSLTRRACIKHRDFSNQEPI